MRNLLIGSLVLILVSSLFFIVKNHEQTLSLDTAMKDGVSLINGTLPSSSSTTTATSDTPTNITTTTSAGEEKSVASPTPQIEKTLIAGGCFWCVEADIEKLKGVSEGVSGYAEGTTENPTYQNYHDGGHREVVEVTYDKNVVSLREITIYAIKHMDPTDGDGSFHDRGQYYAPALYYKNEEEKKMLEDLIKTIDNNGPYKKPLAVKILPLPPFYPAEDYHQNYYKGTLSQVKYQYYRKASGRDDFIKTHWGEDTGPTLPWEKDNLATVTNNTMNNWNNYKKPDEETLKTLLDPLTFKVTQEEGTERAGTHPSDKNYERGIYVDVLSGEPLYSSKDKFDSGTGWPSFVKPITKEAVTEHIDKKLFSTRTEIRSAIADNHLGHVFSDGPTDKGGLRYCMNGVALRFVPEAKMVEEGYGDWLNSL